MQSLAGFLIGALIQIRLIQREHAAHRASCILKWSHCITFACCVFFMTAGRFWVRLSAQEMAWLFIASFVVPMTIGVCCAMKVLQSAPILDLEADGLFAARILDAVSEMSSSYESTFSELLFAILDEDGSRALSLAEELDAHGSPIKEFTVLVREAFG